MPSAPAQRLSRTCRLLDGVRAVERTAIGSVIQRYEGYLVGSVRRLLGPEAFRREGEDLLQEIRLALAKALPSFQGKDTRALRAWVKRVIQSQFQDWLKYKHARRRTPSRPLRRIGATNSPDPSSRQPTPSKEFLREEEVALLERAIDLTRPRYRDVLRFISKNSPSAAEIAIFVGKEPEAARKFAERALKELRRVLRAGA